MISARLALNDACGPRRSAGRAAALPLPCAVPGRPLVLLRRVRRKELVLLKVKLELALLPPRARQRQPLSLLGLVLLGSVVGRKAGKEVVSVNRDRNSGREDGKNRHTRVAGRHSGAASTHSACRRMDLALLSGGATTTNAAMRRAKASASRGDSASSDA